MFIWVAWNINMLLCHSRIILKRWNRSIQKISLWYFGAIVISWTTLPVRRVLIYNAWFNVACFGFLILHLVGFGPFSLLCFHASLEKPSQELPLFRITLSYFKPDVSKIVLLWLCHSIRCACKNIPITFLSSSS